MKEVLDLAEAGVLHVGAHGPSGEHRPSKTFKTIIQQLLGNGRRWEPPFLGFRA